MAKVLAVSQPTVTRTRQRLEKEYIRTYTLVPLLDKIGYEIIAFTFKSKSYEKSENEKMVNSAKEWCDKHSNVILRLKVKGLGRMWLVFLCLGVIRVMRIL